jgi:hypothetical protein
VAANDQQHAATARLSRSERKATELSEAFVEWAQDHGPLWWPTEERLAEAICDALGIDLSWGGRKTKVTRA